MQERGGSLFAAVRRQFPFAQAAAVARAHVGLQFRGDQLALARLVMRESGAPLVEQLSIVPAEAARRGEAVRRLAHTGVLRDARVHLVLAPGEYDLYQLPAPNVPDDEMRDALRWQLRGTLPYAPEVAEIDYVRVPAPPEAADQAIKPGVLVVAAPRATVDELVAPFAAVGIEVHAVDVPEFSQRNLALLGAHGDIAADGCVAWLSFDADACVLTVQTGANHPVSGDLCFTRRIHIPGANGAPPNAVLETEHTVTYLIERIVTQVQRSLDVFERQSGQPAVLALTVGPHRHGAQVASELSDRLALACRTFEPARVLQTAADLPVADAHPWAEGLAALGAALRAENVAGSVKAGLAGAIAQRLRAWSAPLRRAA